MPAQQALLSSDDRTLDEPLPSADDLRAIRLLALPDLGPPFDDDPARAIAAAGGGTPGPGCSGTDGVGYGLAAGGPVAGATGCGTGSAAPGAGAVRPNAGTGTDERGAGTAGYAADRDWSPRFALLLTEALSGARPVRQILPLTTERARAHLDRLMPLFSGGHRPRVLRVITTRPTRDVIEMTVVVCVGTRTRALAVRLERAWQPERGTPLTAPPGTRLTGPAERPARPGHPPAPRWLCTDIEAA